MNRNKNNVKKDSNNSKGNYRKSSGYKGKGKGRGKEKEIEDELLNFDPKRNFKKKTGNPSRIYFTDERLAEQCAGVTSRSVLDTSRPISQTHKHYPNIIAYHMNPSPGVTAMDFTRATRIASPLSISALKLRTAIAANTGRVVSYSGTDVLVLLMMIGEYISNTEFVRRLFGLTYKYADLNRDIPRQLIEACGIDVDDFIKHRNSYLTEVNFYINLGSQIVIPEGKVGYFTKCEEMYQKVYRDGTEDLTCYHIMVPHSTWLLDETYETGTHLKTVNITGEHYTKSGVGFIAKKTTNAFESGTSNFQPHTIWTFGEYLEKVYKPLVVSLLDSATFNNIYSDLRSTKFQSAYGFNFWKAELIDEHYQAPIEDDDSMLSIFHNMTQLGAPIANNSNTKVDANGVHLVTPSNDVYSDPNTDTLCYNPVFLTMMQTDGEFTTWETSLESDVPLTLKMRDLSHLIEDFKSFTPSLDDRVDALEYQVSSEIIDSGDPFSNCNKFSGVVNFNIPDHYCTGRYTRLTKQVSAAIAELEPILIDDELKRLFFMSFNNYWYPLSYDNHLGAPLYGATMNTQNTSNTIYSLEGREAIATVDEHCPGITMTYVDGIGIGQGNPKSEVHTHIADTFYHQSFANCDINNFYTVPADKHRTLLSHSYQTLYTADGIIK